MDGVGTENAILPLWTVNPSAQKGSLGGGALSKPSRMPPGVQAVISDQTQIQGPRVANGVSRGKSSLAFLSLSFVNHEQDFAKGLLGGLYSQRASRSLCTEPDTWDPLNKSLW